MGFFLIDWIDDIKLEIEIRKVNKTATFQECLEDLFGEQIDPEKLRRAYVFYLFGKEYKKMPGADQSVYQALLHYWGMFPKSATASAAHSTIYGAYYLIRETNKRDPYEAKVLLERLFSQYPKLLPECINLANQEDSEKNLVFLTCANLFGWCEGADVAKAATYVEKLGALESLKEPEAYEWLKAQIKE